MFFGKTGVGKSTTILYLAGEIMEKVMKSGLHHIDAKRPLVLCDNLEL